MPLILLLLEYIWGGMVVYYIIFCKLVHLMFRKNGYVGVAVQFQELLQVCKKDRDASVLDHVGAFFYLE